MMQRLSKMELKLREMEREVEDLRKELVEDFACLCTSELAAAASRLGHARSLIRAENSRRQRGG